jgi:hypothetical protein
VAGLNPDLTAEEELHDPEAVAKRHALNTKYNYFEPEFPWGVIPFSPGLFSLEEIQDPLFWDERHVKLT